MNDDFFTKVRVPIFCILFIIFIVVLYYSRMVILISIIGIGFGVLLSPILSYFERKWKVPTTLSAVICAILLIVAAIGISYGIWNMISSQAKDLLEQIPEISTRLNYQLSEFLSDFPLLRQQVTSLNLAAGAKEFSEKILQGLQLSFAAMVGLGFAFILGLYAAVSMDEYYYLVVQAFPQKQRIGARRILRECSKTLRHWFVAQMIDMSILGLITALGLWSFGVRYWAIFGLMTAIFGIVPYIGALFVVVVASIITLASDPHLVIWVVVVFTVAQQIEGNIILPLIMRGRIKLPEVPFLIFIFLFGSWFGIIGVFLAPPIFAILRVLYLELYIPFVDRRNHGESILNKS